jgi:ribosomal protein L29
MGDYGGKFSKGKFRKKISEASKNDLIRMYNELKTEYAKVAGQPVRFKGGLGKEAGKMKIVRRQIAQLLTIARERGISIQDREKDIARLRLRI